MAQETIGWYETLGRRVNALRGDRSHPSFTYKYRMPSQRATREQIVDIYEQAYSELSGGFHGLEERIRELEGEQLQDRASIGDLLKRKKDLEHRLGQTGRRLWGVLSLLEQRFREEFPQVSGMQTTDYYFDGQSMYDD